MKFLLSLTMGLLLSFTVSQNKAHAGITLLATGGGTVAGAGLISGGAALAAYGVLEMTTFQEWYFELAGPSFILGGVVLITLDADSAKIPVKNKAVLNDYISKKYHFIKDPSIVKDIVSLISLNPVKEIVKKGTAITYSAESSSLLDILDRMDTTGLENEVSGLIYDLK